MREIKFRQRIDNNWHYWGMIDGKFISPADSSSGENPSTTAHQQYTGLKDKNGKEIYEGDILNQKDDDAPMVMEWDSEDGFICRMIGTNGLYFGFTSLALELKEGQPFEVIGNIYENPELL